TPADLGTLVRLGMGAETEARLLAVFGHELQIDLEGIEVDQQCRRGQVGLGSAYCGRLVRMCSAGRKAGGNGSSKGLAAIRRHGFILCESARWGKARSVSPQSSALYGASPRLHPIPRQVSMRSPISGSWLHELLSAAIEALRVHHLLPDCKLVSGVRRKNT